MSNRFRQSILNFKIKVREKMNPYLGPIRRKFCGVNSFTIVSNNCWGGHVYRYFNMPYSSPTVGLYIFSEDYVRFVYDFKKYMMMDLDFISYKESKYKDEIINNKHTHVPIGKLGDVEIVFLHYKTKEEALEKWNRRKSRICWDNLIFKMSEQNLCTLELLKAFDSLPQKNKIIFVHKDYGLLNQIVWKEYKDIGCVPDDTSEFRKYVNLSKLVKKNLM